MKTLLIADDERTIREGIANSIDWESLGISQVLLATDGQEAFEMIQTEKPTIALIDIVMPEMTGLEVIARTHKTDHGPEFIIISGHDEFDYARKAIAYNVHNYILKPCDAQEITQAVKKVLEKLEQRQAIIDSQLHLKEYVDILTPPAQEQLLRDFLLDGAKGRDLIAKTLSEAQSYQLLLFSVSDPDDYPLLPALRTHVQKHSASLGWNLSTMLREGIVLIYQAEAEHKVKETVSWIGQAAKVEGISTVRAAMSGVGFLDDLPQLYDEACAAIRHLSPETPGEIPLIDASTARYSKAVRDTMQYVREHLNDQSLSLQHIATNILFLSPDYLGRLFKKECGIRFSNYLLMLRMEKAKQLISMSASVKMYEVAQQVGLGDNAAYFGQVFRKYTGMLPSDYRDLHRADRRDRSEKILHPRFHPRQTSGR
jgi:two-component system response regulator YesN